MSEQRAEKPEAVVLLSGGLDSATVLAIARDRGFVCRTLSLAYGQRHEVELDAAARVSESLGARSHTVVPIDLRAIGGSALTADIDVPKSRDHAEMASSIPVTYVPARNLVFLSLACAHAEVVGSTDVFIGVNAVDYSGYPDCRPEFIESFARTANLATKAGVEGARFTIHTPLAHMPKSEIIRHGTDLGVDYGATLSCYDPDGTGAACGECDSCILRKSGFQDAGIPDPTRYAASAT